MRVLLVDNDDRVRGLLASLLGQLGFAEVIEADNGSEAIVALAEGPVDLVITDLQMPHMDGIGLVRRLREGRDGTPVIMISGLDQRQIIALAKEAGVDEYLTKPVDVDALSDAIGRVLSGPKKTRKPATARSSVLRRRRRRTA